MEEYGNAVLHTCFVCLSDRQLAEDAMQDTFVKAWRAMDRLHKQGPVSEKAWLLRIAINTCHDYRRGIWFRKMKLTAEMDQLPPALIAVSAGDRELFLDVMRLPDKYRQVVLLRYYQNMNLREMGDVLGLSPAAIHHRLKKAEGMLRLGLEGRDTVEV